MLSSNIWSQANESKATTILFDAQMLTNPKYALGIGFMPNYEKRFKSCGIFLTTEWKPANRNQNEHFIGLRGLGVIRHKFLHFGYSLGVFSNFKNTFAVFTPEIGLGFKYCFLLYQFNIGEFNRENFILGRHNLSLRIYLPLK